MGLCAQADGRAAAWVDALLDFWHVAPALALSCCWGMLTESVPQRLASLTQNASSSSSCSSGFSLLLQRAERSDESEQA